MPSRALLEDFCEKNSDLLYFVFRVFVGLLFFQHGVQKLFGWFTDKDPVTLISQRGLAGLIEFGAGLAIASGLLTRPLALIAALEMVAAYFIAHFPKGWIPIENRGELALLYFAAFLIISWRGAGRWSLEAGLIKREIF